MTRDEFKPLASRISALWAPRMDAESVAAYFGVLGALTAARVAAALTVVASTDRERRPPAGLLLETALGLPEPDQRALAAPQRGDVLTPAQHRAAVVELMRPMSPEHRRRHAGVLALLPHRVPLGDLEVLTSARRTGGEAFDQRLAALRRELGAQVVEHTGAPRCPAGCDEGYDVLEAGWRACLGCGRTWYQED